MLHLNAPPFFDDGIGFLFELHHGRKISRNCICCPNFRMNNAVKRPAKFFDCSKASEGILAVRKGQNMFYRPHSPFIRSSSNGVSTSMPRSLASSTAMSISRDIWRVEY